MIEKIENILYSSVAKQSISFEILSLEKLYQRFDKTTIDIFSPHRIQFHALLIITEGKGTHTIDFKEQILSPGTIIPLVKGQVHAFNKTKNFKGFVLSLEESFITNALNEKKLFHFLHLFHTPSILVGKENVTLLLPFIEILLSVQDIPNPNLKIEFISSIFMALIYQIKRLTIYQHEVFESQRFKDFIQFKELVGRHYQESHNAKEYANMMKVSYNYLNGLCKELANETAKAFIDGWLLLEIKRNISEQKYTSQEIAFRMGFNEPSNFIRFFKKHTNTTPRKFIYGNK